MTDQPISITPRKLHWALRLRLIGAAGSFCYVLVPRGVGTSLSDDRDNSQGVKAALDVLGCFGMFLAVVDPFPTSPAPSA